MTKQKNYKENQINLTTGIEKLTKFVIMKKEEILKLIDEQIASQENLAEEYIQELDNEEDADLCFYAIEILKELKQQIINNENN